MKYDQARLQKTCYTHETDKGKEAQFHGRVPYIMHYIRHWFVIGATVLNKCLQTLALGVKYLNIK